MLRNFAVKIIFLLLIAGELRSQITYSPVTIPVANNVQPNLGITCTFYDDASQTLYVGGGFTTLGASSRNRIAAIDAATGAIKTWSANIGNGNVYCIKKAGTKIYAAGDFSIVNGSAANCLVELDAVSGAVTHTYSFSSGDVINSFDINGNNVAVGGKLKYYNTTPLSNHVVIINAASGNLVTNPNNTIFGGHKIFKANKIEYINNDVYIAANDSINGFTEANHSIFKINTSNSNLSLFFAGDHAINGYTAVDDFTFDPDNNMMYVIGDFSIINVFNNALYSGFGSAFQYAVKIDLTANTIQNWQPITAFPPFIPSSTTSNCTIANMFSYNSLAELYIYKILNTSYGILASRGTSRYIHIYDKSSAALVDSIGWTNSVLFQDFPTPGKPYERFMDFITAGDKLFVTDNFPSTNPPQCFSYNPTVYEFCLPPENLISPKEINNKTTFCRGSSYTIIQQKGKEVTNFVWSYSGSGATINNNGNDTITINFSYSATPGSLSLHGLTPCGKSTNTVVLNIPFYALPNVSAGRDTSLNCFNNKNVLIQASSALTNPHGLTWSGPSSATSFSLFANQQGAYIATVTDSTNMCTYKDTMQITYDTLRPSISNASGYTVTCNPGYAILSATGSASDSLWWVIGSINLSNPTPTFAPVSDTIIAYIFSKSKLNGCINRDSSMVYDLRTPPTYTIMSSVTSPTTGLPQFLPITCLNDSTLLDANGSASCKIKWILPLSTVTVNDPFYAKTPGVYQLVVNDTVNACFNNSFLGQVMQNTAVPALTMPGALPNINCSYNTATLNASSSTPGTSIQWTAPSIAFSGGNPSVVSQTAWYYATVTNTVNGCFKKDSLQLTQQNILMLNSSNDTIICNGSSVQISTMPIGGGPAFTYSWSNGGGTVVSPVVSPTSTTKYVVTVTDSSACVGIDTVEVTVPPVLYDSLLAFTSCNPSSPTGQIQAYGKGGMPPYRYSINGSSFQSNGIFNSLAYGTYTILISDTLNCTDTGTISLSSSSQAPSPDFIVNTSMMQGDTFVVVDISNPRPDSVQWVFPASVQVVNNSNQFSPIIVSSDTGYFAIQLNAFFGSCQSSLVRNVHFSKFDTASANYSNNNGIKSITLYPNPNIGQFNVAVDLYKSQSFVIAIYDASSLEIVRIPVHESNYTNLSISMPVGTPGTYILKVIAEYDSKQKVFVVSQ
jgi:hypothetical protein